MATLMKLSCAATFLQLAVLCCCLLPEISAHVITYEEVRSAVAVAKVTGREVAEVAPASWLLANKRRRPRGTATSPIPNRKVNQRTPPAFRLPPPPASRLAPPPPPPPPPPPILGPVGPQPPPPPGPRYRWPPPPPCDG